MFVSSFSLSVQDVLGKSWPITLEYNINTLLATGPRTTDIPAGAWSIQLNENVNSLSLTVSHEQFPTQTVIVVLGPQGPSWGNRNFTVRVNGSLVDITLTLCRIRQAPCITVPKSLVETPQSAEAKRLDLRQFQRGIWIDPGDPKARYVGISRINPTTDSPADGYPLTQLRTLIDDRKSGTALRNSTTDGWDRFFFSEGSIDLASQGGFLWVEYGAPDAKPAKPVFLIGLWLPRITGTKSFDVIINHGHSPTASTWIPSGSFPASDGYPYRASTDRNPDVAGFPQTYPYFGLLYLFRTRVFSFFFVHQLVASTKPAILVMPIIPKVTQPDILFQPFNSRAGLHRLLLELQQFLYQLGYGEATFDFTWLEGRTALVDGIKRPQRESSWSVPGTAPSFDNIVIAGHSSGINQVLAMLQKGVSGGGTVDIDNTSLFPPEFYAGVPATFDDHWRELWDLDLSFAGFPANTRDSYLNLAIKWLGTGNNRRFRSYHSAKTGEFANFAALTGSKQIVWQNPPTRMTNPDAQDWRSQDERVTFMHFSDDYLSASSPPSGISPVFPQPNADWFWIHQFAMILGFGHASALRFVR